MLVLWGKGFGVVVGLVFGFVLDCCRMGICVGGLFWLDV